MRVGGCSLKQRHAALVLRRTGQRRFSQDTRVVQGMDFGKFADDEGDDIKALALEDDRGRLPPARSLPIFFWIGTAPADSPDGSCEMRCLALWQANSAARGRGSYLDQR
mmetsp:Transcript_10651/g.16705  ORF Transcript_10651/g.16705 Transcript_10651/m.16705 type:complete len:109 (-) Transcript_10651:259-585(-)